jgi:hypothetical protein
MHTSKLRGMSAALLAASALILVGGCATHQGRVPMKSGFLGDYSQLHEGTDDQPQLMYVKSGVDFHAYDKIILDPIQIYCEPGKSWLSGTPMEEMQVLVDYFDAAIRKSLGDDITFVDTPGPNVLRLRLALTEAKGGSVARDIASSVIPISLAISTMKRVIANAATGVGEAAVEGEILDSVTGERLAAGVDKRIGEKFTGHFDKFDRWRAPKAAFDYWAMRMKFRLVKAQGRPTPA